jgi:mannosyl-oligosaccharide glucosidase
VSLRYYGFYAADTFVKLRCMELYQSLRKNIITNIWKEYDRTGYFWEQYDDKTGKGVRGHPFSGWTILFANLVSENYD